MRGFVDKPEIEYLTGRAVRKVSPKHRHAVVQGALVSLLRQLARGRGTVGTEWRFKLAKARPPAGKTQLVPDVAFVSYTRWRPLSEKDREEPPFAPDVAVEVRSPGDRIANVLWKMQAYLDAGAVLALDVLPAERRIVAYSRAGVREFGERDTFAYERLPWLRFGVSEAFSDLEPGE